MLEAMKTLAEKSVMERVVLLVNHVISAEPQAMERLRTHASRTIRIELEGWPAMLPPPFPLAFRITPPGLVEWTEVPVATAPDLRVGIAAANPALVLAKLVVGERPAITVDGDAAFATDVNWLIENLRWDVQDDLARLVGDGPAREIARFGGAVAKALREGAKKLDEFARRAAPRGDRPAAEPPPR
jgi:ubiquinone biosynthesis accessory factor UbiJ